MLRMQLQMYI